MAYVPNKVMGKKCLTPEQETIVMHTLREVQQMPKLMTSEKIRILKEKCGNSMGSDQTLRRLLTKEDTNLLIKRNLTSTEISAIKAIIRKMCGTENFNQLKSIYYSNVTCTGLSVAVENTVVSDPTVNNNLKNTIVAMGFRYPHGVGITNFAVVSINNL